MSDIKLYEINNILKDSLDMLDGTEDEEERKQGELAIQEQIKEMIIAKSNNLLGQYRYFETNIDAIDAEIKRLQELKKSQKRQQESFVKYVDYNFRELGVNEVETPFGKIKYRKAPLSVEILEENVDTLPVECVRTKIVNEPDKTAIKELYKKGIILPNVIYHDNEEKLSFK